ncbi:hypothetical protein D3C75_577820 [compost metagenome]
MSTVNGIHRIAYELDVHHNTIRKLMRKYPDFPATLVAGSYQFEVQVVKAWIAQHHQAAYNRELQEGEAFTKSEFARQVTVSGQLVSRWMERGLPYKKLSNGIVLIEKATAREWLLKQESPRLKAHATKLQHGGGSIGKAEKQGDQENATHNNV